MKEQSLFWKKAAMQSKYRIGEILVYTNKRSRQLKSILNFESETDKEIRTDLEGRILKNTARIFENRQ